MLLENSANLGSPDAVVPNPLASFSVFPIHQIVSDPTGRFEIPLLGPNHTVDDRLLLLLEQILEDELTPSAAACVYQRATLV
jgi:hypothetical protein